VDISGSQNGNVLIIDVQGRMDTTTAAEVEKKCLEMISGNKNILIDMDQVEYVSSAGLRSILSVGKKVRSDGGILAFCNDEGKCFQRGRRNEHS